MAVHGILARFALVVAVGCVAQGVIPQRDGPHLANGFKIGDVTASTAVVWTRLTAHADAVRPGLPFAKAAADAPQLPDGAELAQMEGAVPGAAGEVRVGWCTGDQPRYFTPWQAVDEDADFTCKFELTGLRPGCRYELFVEARASGKVAAASELSGSFRTAPAAEVTAEVAFCVVTGQEWTRRDDAANGHRIYPSMLELAPDFLVHTGDTIYYDKPLPFATDPALARFKWNRVYGLPFQREFHQRVSGYFLKDDHDTLKDDCWPGQRYHDLSWELGLALYREQLPVAEPPYRRVRWGKDLEVWFVEGREYRSPNKMADGPEKTIWGRQQWQWLQRTMAASDATFRVLVSPTPIVGPDRSNKNDNHANQRYTHEGNRVRRFLASLPDTVVICGDRHWQYVSRDAETGLREFSCGPTSDRHAGGFQEKNRTAEHEYLRVAGGFLHVCCERDDAGPRLVLRHRDVDGGVRNEVVLRPGAR